MLNQVNIKCQYCLVLHKYFHTDINKSSHDSWREHKVYLSLLLISFIFHFFPSVTTVKMLMVSKCSVEVPAVSLFSVFYGSVDLKHIATHTTKRVIKATTTKTKTNERFSFCVLKRCGSMHIVIGIHGMNTQTLLCECAIPSKYWVCTQNINTSLHSVSAIQASLHVFSLHF